MIDTPSCALATYDSHFESCRVAEFLYLANRAPAEDLERDAVLKRLKERNFGFKLFIRTFIQVCAYHLRSSLGSNSFSFDVINSSPFQVSLGTKRRRSSFSS
jgi:hypothetical protein